MKLSAAEVRDRMEAIVSRGWSIERLSAVWQDRRAGLSMEQIAERDGTGPENVRLAVHRMLEAGLLGPRLSEWTPATINQFKALWIEGHPIAEIARRIGVTDNAIIGKSHRLIAQGEIAARPRQPRQARKTPEEKAEQYQRRLANQQIRRRATERPPSRTSFSDAEREQRRAAAAARWQPPAEQTQADSAYREPASSHPEATRRLVPTALSRPLKPAPRPKPEPYVPPPPKYGRIAECCWPLGTPGTPGFHFCDQSTDPGRPYCHRHVQKAYVKTPVSERREARA